MTPEQIAKNIRKNHKLTQPEFAEKLGVSKALIGMMETGGKALSLGLMRKISLKFGVPMFLFFMGNEASRENCLTEDAKFIFNLLCNPKQ
jgi:transcriptional regulator with XRE-family HTH domain